MRLLLLALACLVLPAQTQDPANDPPEKALLEKAYRSLREKKYLDAIDHFQQAAKAASGRASIHKELGYAYLKVGETERARDAFEQALRLEPGDFRTALELAFLCHETGREGRALELFELVSRSGDAEGKKTAEEAFARVDGGLRRAIERWSTAVEQDPSNRAARLELARNLEKHREPARAAEHYLAAWQLPPRREEILLDLARAREDAGDKEGAVGAWLLASGSAETRVAERARARLPRRHPYANEYLRALDLDPAHSGVRRDLAFLWLAVKETDKAMRELEAVARQNPADRVAAAQIKALQEPKPPGQALPHKLLAEKSLALSYLQDAKREFHIAYEMDPQDYEVALKLGVVHNLLKEDHEAVRWFRLAARSPDATVAEAARRSYENLDPQFRRVQVSVWALPLFSTRFHDAFHYAQVKAEFRPGRFPVRPYLSLRLVGDWNKRTAEPLPQFLSESSLIAAAGVRTPVWRGLMLWAEAGQAVSYLKTPPPGVPRFGPDYRGGLAFFRKLGASLGGEKAGAFAEFNADAVYLSRFGDNVIAYWQMRQGWRLPNVGWWRSQLFWNGHVTLDRRREAYANFVEFGPGYRFRLPGVSPPLDVTVSTLRGVYLINESNPWRPNYYDLRIGLWYSVAR